MAMTNVDLDPVLMAAAGSPLNDDGRGANSLPVTMWPCQPGMVLASTGTEGVHTATLGAGLGA